MSFDPPPAGFAVKASTHSNASSTSSALTEIDDIHLNTTGPTSPSTFSENRQKDEQDEVDTSRMEVDETHDQMPFDKALKAQTSNYVSRVSARAAFLQPSPSYRTLPESSTSASSSYSSSYTFSPLFSIPQSGIQTNALALPPCSSHLLTGGSDGYIRRYSWYQSIRRKGASDCSAILKGYWENPSISSMEALAIGDVTKARFGPSSITGTVAAAVAVHSLIVQKEELFCLAGSAEGVVNLFGVRIDEGQVRASLGMNSKGHKKGKPISALTFTDDERSVLSGGWDAQVLQWDLTTGQCSHEYSGHIAQVSDIQVRPAGMAAIEVATAISPDVSSSVPEASCSLVRPPETHILSNDETSAAMIGREGEESKISGEGDDNDDAASNISYDPLFDEERESAQQEASTRASPAAGGTPSADSGLSLPGLNISMSHDLQPVSRPPIPSQSSKPALPPQTKLPKLEKMDVSSWNNKTFPHNMGEDCFFSLAIDGQCLLWDRRMGKSNVRKLDLPNGTPPWAASATWSPFGTSIYIGRRNATVDMYDLRTLKQITIRVPTSSGRVTSLLPFANDRHLLIGSNDTLRLWDLKTSQCRIVSSHGAVTNIRMDAREKYLFTAHGSRGWLENGKEEVSTFEINA